jgi:hypothetical protein
VAYERKPTFSFDSASETGIYSVPEGSFILNKDTGLVYKFNNNSGLNQNSTLQDAIAGGNLINIGGDLLSDGSIPMDTGYTPNLDQDIATKISIKAEINNSLMFDEGMFGGI